MRVHVVISGLVQGVGFRFFLSQKAQEMGLTGWVKNKKDGKIEAEFQAVTHAPNEFVQNAADEQDKAKLEQIVALCKQGPSYSDVDKVDVKWDKGEEDYDGFEVRE
jgi:acylphosphatase